jgi:hypothetical protein
MKLLIDTKAQKVLFAEAGKDIVDFLFSLLALTVSTAVKLAGKDSIVGSVGNLYASVEELDETFLQGVAKSALLRPTATTSPAISSNSSLLCLPEPSSGKPKTFYICMGITYSSYCRTYLTDVNGKACPYCGSSMTTVAKYLSGEPGSRQGTPPGRICAGHRDVHGAGQPDGDAHVRHLQHHPAQHLGSVARSSRRRCRSATMR